MNSDQRAALKRYHQRLVHDLVVTEELLVGLLQEGVFDIGMIQLIRVSYVWLRKKTVDYVNYLF